MIDVHCHILPGIDDGPRTLEESLALARAALAAGTTAVVATPHVSWDYVGNTAASIAAEVDALRDALEREGIALPVFHGAEVAMTRAMDLPDEDLIALRLGGRQGTHLLIECPLAVSAAGFEDSCLELHARGHGIVLAHPERCPTFHRDPAAYERLIAAGLLGQLTASSLSGRFGRTAQTRADHLLRDGLAQIVASDAHSADRRPPAIRSTLQEAGYGDHADWLARAVPRAVLTGTPVPPAPAMWPSTG